MTAADRAWRALTKRQRFVLCKLPADGEWSTFAGAARSTLRALVARGVVERHETVAAWSVTEFGREVVAAGKDEST